MSHQVSPSSLAHDAITAASHARAAALIDEAPIHRRSDDTVLFARLIAAREVRGELPLLGLAPAQLDALFVRHFPWSTLRREVEHPAHEALPSAQLSEAPPTQLPGMASGLSTAAPHAWPPLVDARLAGFTAAMRTLLLEHADPRPLADDAYCIASIVAHACLRPDHLWRDLGLDGRDDVTRMLTRYVPSLVARNTGGLRWKKFLARELAFAQGTEPGPAPGCPQCEDFGFCFPV